MTTQTCRLILLALGMAAIFANHAPSQEAEAPRFAKRWIYASFNRLIDEHADRVVALIERGRKARFNGIVLADYKLNVLQRLPKRYFQNLSRVQQAGEKAGVEIIPTVCPIG